MNLTQPDSKFTKILQTGQQLSALSLGPQLGWACEEENREQSPKRSSEPCSISPERVGEGWSTPAAGSRPWECPRQQVVASVRVSDSRLGCGPRPRRCVCWQEDDHTHSHCSPPSFPHALVLQLCPSFLPCVYLDGGRKSTESGSLVRVSEDHHAHFSSRISQPRYH